MRKRKQITPMPGYARGIIGWALYNRYAFGTSGDRIRILLVSMTTDQLCDLCQEGFNEPA